MQRSTYIVTFNFEIGVSGSEEAHESILETIRNLSGSDFSQVEDCFDVLAFDTYIDKEDNTYTDGCDLATTDIVVTGIEKMKGDK